MARAKRVKPRKFVICYGSHSLECMVWMKPFMETADNLLLENVAIDDPKELVSGKYKDKSYFEWYEDSKKNVEYLHSEFSDLEAKVLNKLRKEGKKIYLTEEGFTTSANNAGAGGKHAKTKIDEIYELDEKQETGLSLVWKNLLAVEKTTAPEKRVEEIIENSKIEAEWLGKRDAERVRWVSNNRALLKGTTFIEAGGMHQSLHHRLKNILKNKEIKAEVSPVFFVEREQRKVFGGRKHVFTPGDELTLLYLTEKFTKKYVSKKKARDLAARQLFCLYFSTRKGMNEYEAIKKAQEKGYKDLTELRES